MFKYDNTHIEITAINSNNNFLLHSLIVEMVMVWLVHPFLGLVDRLCSVELDVQSRSCSGGFKEYVNCCDVGVWLVAVGSTLSFKSGIMLGVRAPSRPSESIFS